MIDPFSFAMGVLFVAVVGIGILAWIAVSTGGEDIEYGKWPDGEV